MKIRRAGELRAIDMGRELNKQYHVTSYLERELKEQKYPNLATPLKPAIVRAKSHEEAARIARQEKEIFHGEPVRIVQTTLIGG